MAMSVVRQQEIAVPYDLAFSFIGCYHTIPSWMYGISAIEPLNERTHGVGARFGIVFSGGAGATEIELEVVEWQDGHLIALKSVRGPDVVARFRVTALAKTITRIRVEIEVPAPAGLTGIALRTVTKVIVGQAIRHTEASLRRELETRYAARPDSQGN